MLSEYTLSGLRLVICVKRLEPDSEGRLVRL